MSVQFNKAVAALHKQMTFDDIAGWIEEHVDLLASRNKDLKRNDLVLRDVTFAADYGTVEIESWSTPGFSGVLQFRASHYLSLKEAAGLFKGTGIIIDEPGSWAANHVLEGPGKITHSLRVHLLAHEWLVMATTYKLTHEH